ncbi:ATP-binding protein [Actinomadura sp. WMMB 499]|uniref:ATP-binding protein n=1 Tax=Actinomadura sp. WMMB 499 TaxID=1219491 RepID=UPI00124634E3|nr:ATP-binding protein [Actinomadura sp. WMMB 499]QFG23055.1 ATP-binding protein [Actinomadura sp. WMMB 499]
MRELGTVSLAGVARSAPRARKFVRRLVPDAAPDVLADVALCVDELVANACEHTASGAGGTVTVVVSGDGSRLRVTVLDDGGSDGKPCVRGDAWSEGGRGLQLVEALSAGWGSHAGPHGTAVWAEFRLAP